MTVTDSQDARPANDPHAARLRRTVAVVAALNLAYFFVETKALTGEKID